MLKFPRMLHSAMWQCSFLKLQASENQWGWSVQAAVEMETGKLTDSVSPFHMYFLKDDPPYIQFQNST